MGEFYVNRSLLFKIYPTILELFVLINKVFKFIFDIQ